MKKSNIFYKNIFMLFSIILIFSLKTFCQELDIYTAGKEPILDFQVRKEPTYRTRNLTRPSIMVQLEHVYDKSFDQKIKNVSCSGTNVNESGTKKNFLRIHLKNPVNLAITTLYMHIQHYVADIPESRTKTAYSRSIINKSKLKPYEKEFYKIQNIQPFAQLVLDTKGIQIDFSKHGFIDDPYDRAHSRLDDTYMVETGEVYAGYIISFFDDRSLILQMTSNKSLEDKGIKNLNET